MVVLVRNSHLITRTWSLFFNMKIISTHDPTTVRAHRIPSISFQSPLSKPLALLREIPLSPGIDRSLADSSIAPSSRGLYRIIRITSTLAIQNRSTTFLLISPPFDGGYSEEPNAADTRRTRFLSALLAAIEPLDGGAAAGSGVPVCVCTRVDNLMGPQ